MCQAALSPPLGGSDSSAWDTPFSKGSLKGLPSCLTLSRDSAAFNELVVSERLVSSGEATC